MINLYSIKFDIDIESLIDYKLTLIIRVVYGVERDENNGQITSMLT